MSFWIVLLDDALVVFALDGGFDVGAGLRTESLGPRLFARLLLCCRWRHSQLSFGLGARALVRRARFRGDVHFFYFWLYWFCFTWRSSGVGLRARLPRTLVVREALLGEEAA